MAPSVTITTIKRAVCGENGEQRSGREETAETRQFFTVEELSQIVDGLDLRHRYFTRPFTQADLMRIEALRDVSVLHIFGMDRQKAFVHVFVNSGQVGPTFDLA